MIKAVLTFNDGAIGVHTSDIAKTSTTFESGFYSCVMTDNGPKISTEKVEELNEPFPCKEFSDILNYTRKFYEPELKSKINKMGFKHKLGVLLYGIQGTGKTTFLYYLADQLRQHRDAVVFICRDAAELNGGMFMAKLVREIQDNPIIFIGDEFERWASKAESEMKTFLDGVDSIDNMLFLAATNYIDKVPKSLKDRPSRFKAVSEIKMITNKTVIYDLIKKKADIINLMSDDEINKIAKELSTNGVTLDQLKNSLLDKVLGAELGIQSKEIGYKNTTEGDEDFLNMWSSQLTLSPSLFSRSEMGENFPKPKASNYE